MWTPTEDDEHAIRSINFRSTLTRPVACSSATMRAYSEYHESPCILSRRPCRGREAAVDSVVFGSAQ